MNKKLSVDPSFNGDFNLKDEIITKDDENHFIFTGLQITNRSFLVEEKSQIFSMNKIWNALIKTRNLNGLESNQKFFHLNTFEMYKKILSFNITD